MKTGTKENNKRDKTKQQQQLNSSITVNKEKKQK